MVRRVCLTSSAWSIKQKALRMNGAPENPPQSAYWTLSVMVVDPVVGLDPPVVALTVIV